MKTVKLVYVVLMVVTQLATWSYGETYHIDAASATKEILPGGFNMGTPTNPEGERSLQTTTT